MPCQPAKSVKKVMKKILYLSNTPVPYRVKFFNFLAEKCDLTVVYEREFSANRNKKWTSSVEHKYKSIFLRGIRFKNESSFSLRILKYVLASFDSVIVGCYNSPSQMIAILTLRLFNKRFYINLDGEPFIEQKGFKAGLKKFFLKGADGYFTAGEKSADSLKKIFPNAEIFPYYFSSLTQEEIIKNADNAQKREDYFLVVGQYFDYKGLDVAAEVAKSNPNLKFKFAGMGNRTSLFKAECNTDSLKNIEVVPFLQKKELEFEYKKCRALILPSKKECWGLVVNEASAFKTPIISTLGSGAAVEFLGDSYNQFLSRPDDANSLSRAVNEFVNFDKINEYGDYLYKKSLDYSIEKSVEKHIEVLTKHRS